MHRYLKRVLFVISLVTVLAIAEDRMTVNISNENEGDGDYAKKGDRIRAHYTGKLEDGTKFDSSVDRDQPFDFNLGMGRVIRCWDEGFQKMKKGHKAILSCPPEYAYGQSGAGSTIPPNATLNFEVELLDINPEQKKAPKTDSVSDAFKKSKGDKRSRRKRASDGPPVGDLRTFFCVQQIYGTLALAILAGSFVYLISACCMKVEAAPNKASKKKERAKVAQGKAA